MKIAILTITDGQNYGNRLQNYAMQKLLESFGNEVETIQRRTSRDVVGVQKIIIDTKYLIKRVIHYPTNHYGRIRRNKFKKFNQKYINFSRFVLQNNVAPEEICQSYDCFVVGSDQVWNTRFDIVREDLYNHLAMFAPEQKKIAFAASFGTNKIEPGYEEIFLRALNDFRSIGVREKSGVQIVSELCQGKEAQVVLDPTMMISVDQWRLIERKPNYVKGKYIVSYFLGGRGEKITKYIQKIASSYNADVVNLEAEFLQDIQIENPAMFVSSPDEFVWLMDHAECILTDSFHATVFAILFHRPFCTFERVAAEKGNDMGSRIKTLLEMFHLTQYYGNLEHPDTSPGLYDTNNVEKILNDNRKISLNFLSSTLHEER